MRILHIGQAILPTTSSKPLHIRNVLHVPSVKKNLLLDPRLTHDNNVLVEFHPDSFFVKDLLTRAILLRGRCRGGLYALDSIDAPFAKQVFSALKASSAQWHARLGHPLSQIAQHILHRSRLPSESNKINRVCDACQQGKSHQLPFSLSSHVTNAPLELIYSDVWGPVQTSVSGHNY
jgi:histone deacetylase 1/2